MVFSAFAFSSILALQVVPPLPVETPHRLTLVGNPTQNEGLSVYFNLDPTAPDIGHADISLNASGNGAPYYATGRQASPEEPSVGTTRTASLTGITAFPTFSNYVTSNNILLDNIGLSMGRKLDRDFTRSWNLGDDILGQDWFGTPDSPIEERIYQANPDDIEIFLAYGTTKFVEFGYSDLNLVLDYGAAVGFSDDRDVGYTNPINATKSSGLDPLLEGLANAFLTDVNQFGGKVQIVSDDRNVIDDETFLAFGNGFGVANINFPGYLQIVSSTSVPEFSSPIALMSLGFFLFLKSSKKMK